MAKGILARKVGMAQIFNDAGDALPVTVLRAGPCWVTDIKTLAKNKYEAIQLGFEEIKPTRLTKAEKNHLESKGHGHFCRVLREFRDTGMEVELGQALRADIFAAGDTIKVSGVSKGKGFQGVMKRYNYGGGRATHGSHFHRGPGSLGASAYPSRVFKGKKLPGRMGAKEITVMNLKIVQIDLENNLLLVHGAVPGPRRGLVRIEAI